jgi:hypothetical protein
MHFIVIKGIRCDKPGCDWFDDTIKVSQYREYINKPCPKCGANLLTQVDFNITMLLLAIFDNPIAQLFATVLHLINPKIGKEKCKLKMNGTGGFTLEKLV